MGDDLALPRHDDHVSCDRHVLQHVAHGCQSRSATRCGEIDALLPFPALPARCWRPGRLSRGSSGHCSASQSRSTCERPECEIQRTLPQLADLAEAAADGEARHRMGAQILEQAAGEIPHVQHRLERQAVMGAHRILRGRSGAARDMAEPHGPRHVDSAMDGGNPRRTGKRIDDAGGAEDGQPADDAEPRVPCLFCQIASPPGMEISISAAVPPSSAMTSRIIWRGTGLMAGSPGGIGSPALVTMPTPGPALKLMPSPPSRTVATTMQPWVTSGSSPASLMIPARAQPSPLSSSASGKAGVSPLGRVIETGSGNSPVRNAAKAAFTAAVAHAPVVQPRLNSPSGFSLRIGPLYKAAMGLGPTKRIGDWVSAGGAADGLRAARCRDLSELRTGLGVAGGRWPRRSRASCR